ncbi:CotH kinase family protein [Candidatus Saccharibacteria bacterium]|nr:CotH kinase family protein [Candidatus Saccharibacteria bacterium]
MEQQKKQPLSHRKILIATTILIPIIIVASSIIIINTLSQIPEPAKEQFPRIDLTLNEVPIETINNSPKGIIYPDNQLSISNGISKTNYYNVEIKGRGNSTWVQIKKPYQIKLPYRETLLNLNRARKWAFLANYFDESFLRNDIAFWLEKELECANAFQGDFAELYIDDIYYGLYYITSTASIGKEEIDLRNPFGIIVELDNLHHDDNGWYSDKNDYLTVKDIVSEDNLAQATQDFSSAYTLIEQSVYKGDWSSLQKVADVESFAKYYLLSEFTVNPDAYTSSFFMFKDGPEDKIHAGPGWDYDFALGNREWENEHDESFYSPTELGMIEKYAYGGKWNSPDGQLVDHAPDTRISRLIFNMLKIPEFNELVKQIWQEKMSGKSQELINYVNTRADYISSAAEHDQYRWKQGAFRDAFNYLLNWVEERYNFIDSIYGVSSPTPAPTSPANAISRPLSDF